MNTAQSEVDASLAQAAEAVAAASSPPPSPPPIPPVSSPPPPLLDAILAPAESDMLQHEGERAEQPSQDQQQAASSTKGADAKVMLPPPTLSSSALLFRKGVSKDMRIKFCLQRTFGLVEQKELQLAIRKHGGEVESRLGKADYVIVDTKSSVEGRKAIRDASSLGQPIPTVSPQFVHDSVKRGALVDDENYKCKKEDLAALNFTPGMQPQMNGRNPFTAEDRAYIVEYLGTRAEPWNLNAAAADLARYRPTHSHYSFQTYLRDNMKAKWNIQEEVYKWREANPEAANAVALRGASSARPARVHEAQAAPAEPRAIKRTPQVPSSDVPVEEESEPEGGWDLKKKPKSETANGESKPKATEAETKGETSAGNANGAEQRDSADVSGSFSIRDGEEVEDELEIRPPRPAAASKSVPVSRVSETKRDHQANLGSTQRSALGTQVNVGDGDPPSQPDEESEPEGGWTASKALMKELDLDKSGVMKKGKKAKERAKIDSDEEEEEESMIDELDDESEVDQLEESAPVQQVEQVEEPRRTRSSRVQNDQEEAEQPRSAQIHAKGGETEKREKFTDEDKTMLVHHLTELLLAADDDDDDPLQTPPLDFWKSLACHNSRHSAASWLSHFAKNRATYKEAAELHCATEQDTQALGDGGDNQDDSSEYGEGDEEEQEGAEDAAGKAQLEAEDEPKAEAEQVPELAPVQDAESAARIRARSTPEFVPSSPASAFHPSPSPPPSRVEPEPRMDVYVDVPTPSQAFHGSRSTAVGGRAKPPSGFRTIPRSKIPTTLRANAAPPAPATPSIDQRREHHKAKMAAKAGDPSARETSEDALLSPTLTFAAATPTKNPSTARAMGRSAIISPDEQRAAPITDSLEAVLGDDQDPRFPSQPSFLNRIMAKKTPRPAPSERERITAPRVALQRMIERETRPRVSEPLRPTRRTSEALASPVVEVKEEESEDERAFVRLAAQPAATLRNRRRAGRKTFGGFETRSSADAGRPLLERHREAPFYDFTIDSDEEENIKASRRREARQTSMRQAPQPRVASDRAPVTSSSSSRRRRSVVMPEKVRERVEEWTLRTSAELEDEDEKLPPPSFQAQISRNRLSATTPRTAASSSSRRQAVRVDFPSSSRIPSAVANGDRTADQAAEAKRRYTESVKKLCSDYGFASALQAADVLKPNGWDVSRAREALEKRTLTVAARYKVTRSEVLRFVKAADGKWEEAEKFIKVQASASPRKRGHSSLLSDEEQVDHVRRKVRVSMSALGKRRRIESRRATMDDEF